MILEEHIKKYFKYDYLVMMLNVKKKSVI